MLTRYRSFREEILNENVQQAKTFMKNRALRLKKETEGPGTQEKPVGLSPKEVKAAENDPTFVKIRKMVEANPGWTFIFTKFHFEEGISLEDLQLLYNDLIANRQYLSQLPMELLKYPSIKKASETDRGGYETLIDDIETIKRGRESKKFYNELLPFQKDMYDKAPEAIKKQIDDIGLAFANFGKKPDGTLDKTVNQNLQKFFLSKLKADKTLMDIIKRANNYIKGINNSEVSKFFQNIQKINSDLGEMNGVEEVYNNNNVLIVEVKSYTANSRLNGNTSHCIARSQGMWDSYTGADNLYNKQYYIYNFNLPSSDPKSVIGITIEHTGKTRACHTKDDGGFTGNIKGYMEKLGIPFSVLAPMSPVEVEKKKRRVIANKEIVKDGLSISAVKKYFEDGADPNAYGGKPLQNAVKEDNMEKVEYLISVGANPNIGDVIKFAKNLKMIKKLVSEGSSITTDIYNSCSKDYDAVKYLLEHGIDPNFEVGLPLRTATKLGDLKMLDLLISYGADISQRRYMVLKWALDRFDLEIFDFLFKKLKEQKNPIATDPARVEAFIKECIFWCEGSDKLEDAQRDKVINHLKGYLK